MGVERSPSFAQTLWRHFPLVNFAIYAVSIANAEANNLTPPRHDLFGSFLFPLSVPVLFYAIRWRRAAAVEKRVARTLIGGSLAVLAVAYWLAAPHPIDNDTFRHIYEFSAILNTVILCVHAGLRSRAMLAFFLGPAALYGILLENGGIALGYFSELDYALYLGPLPAPVATMSGWITIFYLVTWLVWELRREMPALRRTAWGSALVSTVAALLLDLQIDPLATAVGFWRWNPHLATGPLGVPLLNFVAWACAVFPFSLAVFWRQNQLSLSPEQLVQSPHRRWLWWRIPVVLGAAAVFFCLSMALIEGGFDGPTYQIFYDTAVRWGILA